MIGGQVGTNSGHLNHSELEPVILQAKSGGSASILTPNGTYQGNPVMPIKAFHKFHIALRKLVRSQRNHELNYR